MADDIVLLEVPRCRAGAPARRFWRGANFLVSYDWMVLPIPLSIELDRLGLDSFLLFLSAQGNAPRAGAFLIQLIRRIFRNLVILRIYPR